MAICSHCGMEIPDDVAICSYCDAQVSPDVAICGNCGKIIPADAKVCPYCGMEDSLVMNYNSLNQSYLEKVQEYNSLLAQYINLQSNYTTLYGSFQNLTNFEDEKFIVLLFFTTNYGNNKYWLYLEIDPSLYIQYKQSHISQVILSILRNLKIMW